MQIKKLYSIFLLLLVGACSTFSDSEVFMTTKTDKRPSKPPYMPSAEKSLEAPINPKYPIPPIAPQIGVRVPLQVD